MKNLVFLVVFMLCSFMLQAQQPPQGRQRMTVEDRAKRTTEWMTQELKLTPTQVTPVDSINLLFTKAQQVLFQTAEGDRDKVRESMSALEKEKEVALAKVLTPGQLETYKAKTKEMMDNFRSGRRRAQ